MWDLRAGNRTPIPCIGKAVSLSHQRKPHPWPLKEPPMPSVPIPIKSEHQRWDLGTSIFKIPQVIPMWSRKFGIITKYIRTEEKACQVKTVKSRRCLCLACGILVPQPRIKPPPPLQRKPGVLNTRPLGKSLVWNILKFFSVRKAFKNHEWESPLSSPKLSQLCTEFG